MIRPSTSTPCTAAHSRESTKPWMGIWRTQNEKRCQSAPANASSNSETSEGHEPLLRIRPGGAVHGRPLRKACQDQDGRYAGRTREFRVGLNEGKQMRIRDRECCHG